MRALLASAAATLVLAGCGGGSHTYVVTSSATGGSGVLAAGIYLTIVSPVALPQGLIDQMKKTMTFVEQPVGPEICSYSKMIQGVTGQYAYLNGKTLTVKVNGSNPLISLVCSGLQKRPFNLAGVTAKPKPKTTTSFLGPFGFTASELKRESRQLGTPIYWAGPQAGYTYEFTRNTSGWLYVRYLPNGTQPGAKGHFLIVVTYPFATYAGLKKQAGSAAVPGPNHSLIYQRPNNRKSVVMAFANSPNDQVEVYDFSPAIAIATAESGEIKPVG